MTKRTLLPVLTALALGLAVVPDAYAGDVEKAEHTRLTEEMRKLAQRNAWSAVEANYKRLEELEKKGEVISYQDHWVGAEAARSLGDITSCRARLERATKVEAKKEALDWLAEIDANYGRVAIQLDPKFQGDKTLTPATPPFAPDQRASVASAGAVLAGGKGYTGLLPAGDYTVGGQTFTVAAGGAKVASVNVGPPPAPPKEPFKPAYVGPRASVGVAFTSAGAPAAAEGAVEAVGFGGAGARLGVGLEVGLTDTVGVLAEVGYHNLFGAPKAEDGSALAATDQFEAPGNSMHMGYGWLAATARFGDIWLAAGPLWGAGTGKVTGEAGAPDAATCESEFTTECGLRYQRLSGSIKAGGGAASVSYAMLDLGSLKGAVTLEGGAQTDASRWYPWGQLAFTVAPGVKEKAAAPRRTE